MLANLVCVLDSVFDVVRESAANEIQTFCPLTPRRSEIETRLGLLQQIALEIIEKFVNRRGIAPAVSVSQPLRLRAKLFLHAIDDLARVHGCELSELTHG